MKKFKGYKKGEELDMALASIGFIKDNCQDIQSDYTDYHDKDGKHFMMGVFGQFIFVPKKDVLWTERTEERGKPELIKILNAIYF